jgi:hypothetical protein
MIWKTIALFGAGSFFFVGWGVLTDPLCNSVSFRGGGARTVMTTCYPDSQGDFSKASAGTGSILIGLAILAILFWPLIRAYIVNYRLQLSLKNLAQEIEHKQDFEVSESNESPQDSTQKDSLISTSIQKMSGNKLTSILVIALLIFGLYKVVAPKISLLNPITCASLKKELVAKDVIGRQLWNAYQVEVSNLSQVQVNSNEYASQTGNAARRVVQLKMNDLQGYALLQDKPHCVKSLNELKTVIDGTTFTIKYLSGEEVIDGKKFDVWYGWNTNYYSQYVGFDYFLK